MLYDDHTSSANLITLPVNGRSATAEQRMLYHLGEFRKAAEAHDPRICDWKIWDYSSPQDNNRGAWMIVAGREKLEPESCSL